MLDAGNGGMPVATALAEFGLSHVANLPVTYLSAGQKRRAALAKLLVAKRPVWLLDEPLTALDAASQALLAAIMAAHLAQGGMIVAATHARLGLAGQELRLGASAMKNGQDAPASPALGSSLSALFVREMRAGRRIGGGTSLGVVFFLILVTLSAFAVGPDLALLGKIAPAILWISGLLATLLGLDRLFQADHEDGSLDLLLTSGTPLELIVLVKCLAHWILTGLPLAAAAPFFGLMLDLPTSQLWSVTLSLLAGTPALTLIGAIGAALTVSLRRGGLLFAVLILPLCVPVLIFGVAAAGAGAGSMVPFATPFLILCALTLIAIAGAPFAAAFALRQLNS